MKTRLLSRRSERQLPDRWWGVCPGLHSHWELGFVVVIISLYYIFIWKFNVTIPKVTKNVDKKVYVKNILRTEHLKVVDFLFNLFIFSFAKYSIVSIHFWNWMNRDSKCWVPELLLGALETVGLVVRLEEGLSKGAAQRPETARVWGLEWAWTSVPKLWQWLLDRTLFFLFMLWAGNQHSFLASKFLVHPGDAFSLANILHLWNLLYLVFLFTSYVKVALNPNSVDMNLYWIVLRLARGIASEHPWLNSCLFCFSCIFFLWGTCHRMLRSLKSLKQMWLLFVYDAFFSCIYL